MIKAVCLILVGCGMLIVAILSPRFYWRKGWFSGEKEAPHWVGQMLFGFVGVVVMIVGIADLLHSS